MENGEWRMENREWRMENGVGVDGMAIDNPQYFRMVKSSD